MILSATTMLLLLLQGSPQMAVSDTIVIGVLVIAAGAFTSWLTTRFAAAEWKGAANQKFADIAKDFDGIAVEQNNQWSSIRRVEMTAAETKGEVAAMRRAKSAGHN